MREEIYPHIRHARSLPEVQNGVLHALSLARDRSPERRVGVVPGIVSARGDIHIPWHLDRLRGYATLVQEAHSFPIFTTPYVFDRDLYAQLKECELPREEREVHFRAFWRGINSSGYVTDAFMTPQWELSPGSIDEHVTAQEVGLRIHYLDPVAELEDFDGYVRGLQQQTSGQHLRV